MAQKLGAQLSTERKIMLGVQLYDLISQAGLKQEQVVAFYSSCRRWAWLPRPSTSFINSTRQRTRTRRYISTAHHRWITFFRT